VFLSATVCVNSPHHCLGSDIVPSLTAAAGCAETINASAMPIKIAFIVACLMLLAGPPFFDKR
jgi:hypothetical protein